MNMAGCFTDASPLTDLSLQLGPEDLLEIVVVGFGACGRKGGLDLPKLHPDLCLIVEEAPSHGFGHAPVQNVVECSSLGAHRLFVEAARAKLTV